MIIGDRWPKSGIDVIITILEGEEDRWWEDEITGATKGSVNTGNWGFMSVLSACITAASAALIEAGIDCVDVVSGGTAAIVRNPDAKNKNKRVSGGYSVGSTSIVMDPRPSEHHEILASCAVGYLPQRDEITELWMSGDLELDAEKLIDTAVETARLTSRVLVEAIKDSAKGKATGVGDEAQHSVEDVAMTG